MRRRKHKPQRVKHALGFYVEDDIDYWPDEPHMVGAATSDWGPLETPRSLPWRKKPKETKRAFGFARALED